MQSTVLLSILAVVQSAVISKEEESDYDGITVNGVYHDNECLKTDLDRPYLLTVDDETGDLYFSYSKNNSEKEGSYRSAKLNIHTKEFVEIKGVKDGFATAVNPETFEVYIGGSDGIYTYDKDLNEAKIFGARGTNIWGLYYKKLLYFSTFQRIYTIDKDSNIARMKELEDTKVDHFVIDQENTIFFTNDTGLFTQKLGTKNANLFREFPEVGARALAIDKNGLVFICLQDGVYSINKLMGTLKKLIHIDDAFGLTFDSDNNIIYSDVNGITRLKENSKRLNEVD